MRWLKFALVAVVLLMVAVVAVGYALPAEYKVERTIVINAPPERIYPLVAAPRRWMQWSIWTRRDPQMTVSYFGPETGAGAGWRWDSKTEGRGEMTFTAADPARGLTYKLYFPDFESTSTGDFLLTPDASGTRIIWNNSGSVGSNPLRHYMAVAMDRLVGPDFEAGLANLKVLAEKP